MQICFPVCGRYAGFMQNHTAQVEAALDSHLTLSSSSSSPPPEEPPDPPELYMPLQGTKKQEAT
jgi:hypothetical protein